MAATVVQPHRRQSLGNYWEQIVDVTFDNSYPTNGLPVAAGLFGFVSVFAVSAPVVQGATVRYVTYDITNSKLLAYDPTGTEITNTTDLSAITVRLVVRGR